MGPRTKLFAGCAALALVAAAIAPAKYIELAIFVSAAYLLLALLSFVEFHSSRREN